MPRILAPANKRVLIQARKVMGLDEDTVAKRLHLKREKIQAWEAGNTSPTFRQLESLSDLYRQPLISFFSNTPPEEPSWPRDFRRFPGNARPPLSYETRAAIWEAEWRQSVAAELRREMGESMSLPRVRTPIQSDPETAAEEVRAAIGPDIKAQIGWARQPLELLRKWRAVLEGIGILVFRFDFPYEDARAFALPSAVAPVVSVSTDDWKNAQLFSLLHEFAHLLLGENATCNFIEYETAPNGGEQRIEAVCNHFSGAFLVPRHALVEHEFVRQHKKTNWEENVLAGLAQYFGVSREVVLRRLVILERADEDFYRRWKAEKNELWRDEESTKRAFPVPKGYARKVLNREGHAYVSTVLTAYSQGIANLSEVSDYLKVKTKHVSDIQAVLGQASA